MGLVEALDTMAALPEAKVEEQALEIAVVTVVALKLQQAVVVVQAQQVSKVILVEAVQVETVAPALIQARL